MVKQHFYFSQWQRSFYYSNKKMIIEWIINDEAVTYKLLCINFVDGAWNYYHHSINVHVVFIIWKFVCVLLWESQRFLHEHPPVCWFILSHPVALTSLQLSGSFSCLLASSVPGSSDTPTATHFLFLLNGNSGFFLQTFKLIESGSIKFYCQ